MYTLDQWASQFLFTDHQRVGHVLKYKKKTINK